MKPTSFLRWKTAFLSLVCLAGMQAMAQQQPATPAQPAAAPAPPAAGTSADDTSYIIGPGDTLQVFVWRNAELSATVPVRPDGKISTPLVEDLIVVGKKPSEVARAVEGILSEYIRSPQVNVIVTAAAGVLSQIKVIGEVATPKSVPFRQGMKVLDVLLDAGGLAPYAAGNRAKIVRMEGGKQREIRVRLGDLVNKGVMKHNLDLQPGDVLVVPQSMF